jgi:RimJ/RimL family protein N-acetyltransferase
VYTRLTDGTAIAIREIVPSDKGMLASGIGCLSEESRFRRFLSPKPSLSAAELRYLTEVDGHDHYALVAQRVDDPASIVGVARFVRLPSDRRTAEAAIAVCDSLHGRRLGTQLAWLLADAGRRRGIRRFAATVSSDNPAAMRLMRTLKTRLEDGPHEHGVHEVLMNIAA